jgi:hypothetical protein
MIKPGIQLASTKIGNHAFRRSADLEVRAFYGGGTTAAIEAGMPMLTSVSSAFDTAWCAVSGLRPMPLESRPGGRAPDRLAEPPPPCDLQVNRTTACGT